MTVLVCAGIAPGDQRRASPNRILGEISARFKLNRVELPELA